MNHPLPNSRHAEAEINPLFTDRWSPRSFSSKPIPRSAINSLFEAARWAPSRSNEQPWLFLYAQSEDDRMKFTSALVERNRIWASKAPLLMFILAARNLDNLDTPNTHAWFDCGAAWMSLALEARMHGLHTHCMAGFNREKAYEVTMAPRDRYDIIAAVAVGYSGDRSELQADMAERESPNDRKPLASILNEGIFGSTKTNPDIKDI